MTQKFTRKEVLEMASVLLHNPKPREWKTRAGKMLTAYADTLSKPADSGRAGDVDMLNCPDCLGSGERCLAGCSAHDSNWHKCKRCAGTGKVPQPPEAATAAQGQGDAVAQIDNSADSGRVTDEATDDRLASMVKVASAVVEGQVRWAFIAQWDAEIRAFVTIAPIAPLDVSAATPSQPADSGRVGDGQLRAAAIIYGSGYRQGHEDTVESVYTDVVHYDRATYWLDTVREMVDEDADLRAALAMQVDIYPLPDSLYPQSKDWMAADYAGRVEWLHSMYENRKDELDCLLAAQGQGEAVAWQRRVKPDSGKWLAWEYFAGAIDYDSDPAKFPSRVGRWECEYRALYTHPAPSASPAGVPDSVIVLLNHLETLMDEGKLAEDAIPTEMWNAVSMHNLAAAPSAPASPAGVQDGMVLVPWEPTPVMLAIYEHIRSGSDWQAHVFRLTKRQLNRHRAAYKAMIAAAPSAPTENAGMSDQVRLTIERCLRYQEKVAEQIEKSNPGDPYAALMVREDIEIVRQYIAATAASPAGVPDSVERCMHGCYCGGCQACKNGSCEPVKYTACDCIAAPSAPAENAGVPELHGWTLKLMRDRDGDMSIWACDPDGSSVYLAAAPGAPEGDGGGE